MTPSPEPLGPPPPDVTLCECFARDGLQHEERIVPTDVKVQLLTAFADAGFTRIEASSYSNPARVPAFADVEDLMPRLPRRAGVAFKNTCPNVRAVQRAVADAEHGAGADELSFLLSATDSHSRRNLGRDREDQFAVLADMAAVADGRFRIVGVVSMAFGCPFEGVVPVDRVRADVDRLVALGAAAVSIGDTTGLATPRSTRELFGKLVGDHPDLPVIAHLHDTRGTAIANALAAHEAGVRHFDSAMGGVGGHPKQIAYGSGQTGNVCTEDLVDVFEAEGVSTGLDRDLLEAASRACELALGRELNSRVARAGRSPLDREPAGV